MARPPQNLPPEYDAIVFKIPEESSDYGDCSAFVTRNIETIIKML
jgi:hypothetical protein